MCLMKPPGNGDRKGHPADGLQERISSALSCVHYVCYHQFILLLAVAFGI